MIAGAKEMIAGCIERTRRDDCAGCERRDACASLFRAFRVDRSARREARPAPRRNSFLAFLGEVARTIEARAVPPDASFRREVESHIEPLLATGAIRVETVARALGCSRQTLYRRLKAEGVTFEVLLDGLRHRLALRLVREPGLSVKAIAYRLGFSEPAAFSRAFKRWTGRTPRQASGRQSG